MSRLTILHQLRCCVNYPVENSGILSAITVYPIETYAEEMFMISVTLCAINAIVWLYCRKSFAPCAAFIIYFRLLQLQCKFRIQNSFSAYHQKSSG